MRHPLSRTRVPPARTNSLPPAVSKTRVVGSQVHVGSTTRRQTRSFYTTTLLRTGLRPPVLADPTLYLRICYRAVRTERPTRTNPEARLTARGAIPAIRKGDGQRKSGTCLVGTCLVGKPSLLRIQYF